MSELRAGIYRHYKGLLVQILGVARHSETEEKFVVYVPLDVKDGPRITVRPYEVFFEEIDNDGKRQPRFEFIGETVEAEIARHYHDLSGNKPDEPPQDS
jgi:hypothetical protein